MKFLISVKYTFDIITSKLIYVMQTSRKGNKYFKYLRVDIFCWFIWFQTWLFFPFLDNITLEEYINVSSAFVFEKNPPYLDKAASFRD